MQITILGHMNYTVDLAVISMTASSIRIKITYKVARQIYYEVKCWEKTFVYSIISAMSSK